MPKMRIENIINKLNKEGFKNINMGRFNYWDNVEYIDINEFKRLYIAQIEQNNGSISLNQNFRYKDVTDAIKLLDSMDVDSIRSKYRVEPKNITMDDYLRG
jgi:hypothetical protein